MAGMRDVAKLAGVSLSTVSVVLNKSEKYVSEEHRKRVMDAASELGYTMPAKKRFTQKTIAVILPVITSSFFSNVLHGIESAVSQESSLLLYYNSNFNFDKESACLRTLGKQSLAGVILDTICPMHKEGEYFAWLKQEFVEKKIPVVLLERKIESYGFYNIYMDNYKSAYRATRYLIDKGHKKIAHIIGNDLMQNTHERERGYRTALEDAGLKYDQELVQKGDFTPFSGYAAMKEIMAIRTDFTALFSANDQMAIGAIKAIKGIGKTVPDDIAVVGFDNLSVSSLIEPALTTVNVPTFQLGRLAAKIILEVTEGEEYEYLNELETNLIIRRSSDKSAPNEWELAGW